ncbi:MAG: DMT family transporter [Pseudomonadota bacterium]
MRAVPLEPAAPHWRAWAAVAITLVIWASFLIVTRAAARAELTPTDVGLLRFIPAAILFAPVWLRVGPLPRSIGWRGITHIALPGGFLFVGLLASGAQFAPVADSAVFAPSMLPLYVAILSYFMLGERFSGLRIAGFALILVGAMSVGGWEAITRGESGAWRGHLLVTFATMCWAIYTVNYRKTDLSPMEGAMLLAFWSALGFGLLGLVTPMNLWDAAPSFLAFQVLMQGVLAGYVSTITYSYALQNILPSRVAAAAAMVPVMAALGGWIWLDEPIGWIKAAGIAVVTCGVLLASGAVGKPRR